MPVVIDCSSHLDDNTASGLETKQDRVLDYLYRESQRVFENRIQSLIGEMKCAEHPDAVTTVRFTHTGAYWIREDIDACCLVFYNRLSNALTDAGIQSIL